MSMTWFSPGWEVDVPDPGYGEVDVIAPAHPHQGTPLVTEDWKQTLTGQQIGRFLSAVTDRAFQPDAAGPAGGELPAWLTPAAARTLLPALQQAAVLAAAGSDRYERTWPEEGEPPPGPYCSRCGEGTLFTPGAMSNEWCDQYGHQPYGMGADTGWDTAQRRHDWERRRWERRRRLEGRGA